MGRSRLLEETVIPMKDLLFDESADFTAPGAPNRYLILARVLGFFRSP
jgi:hypothetical protein